MVQMEEEERGTYQIYLSRARGLVVVVVVPFTLIDKSCCALMNGRPAWDAEERGGGGGTAHT